MFLSFLLSLYIYVLLFIFLATVILILFDLSWGQIPHLYVKLLAKIQDKFQEAYPSEYFECLPFRDIITEKKSILECSEQRFTDFEMIDMHTEFPFTSSVNLTRSGLEAIIQDDFSGAIDYAPDFLRYELNWTLWQFTRGHLTLRIMFILMTLIRFGFIFPMRVLLYISSFVFLAICCVSTYFHEFSLEQKINISKRYCRLYTAGIGLIAFYYGEENRPRVPGIAVSNHLSANDIMVICADVAENQDFLYTVTGQQHSGIIGFVQTLVSKLCSTLWLERSIADSRLKFLRDVLTVAKNSHLVLMFPEGYCSNGTRVLQFRKAVFEKHIKIYPIAISQDSRFGDAFWEEDYFAKYLLRLLCNFATIYHVHYLPPQERYDDESPEAFAGRVQDLIGKVANSEPMHFQGTIYYKKHDREKYKAHMQKVCSNELFRLAAESNSTTYQLSASDGP